MGIFSRKKKDKNEIENHELKERLASAAIRCLTPGTDYAQEAYTTCTFGYVFTIQGHGVEALLKVVTDRCTVYFAAQGDKLIRLNFTEEMFKSTSKTFLDLHT